MATTSVEDLEVFKLAHALVLRVYETTRTFPREETFGLVTQLRRGRGLQSRRPNAHAPRSGAAVRESCSSVTSTNTNTIHDIACPDCGGRLRFVATIEDRAVIEKILRHLALPIDPPVPAPARRAAWLPGFDAAGEWIRE